MSLAMERNRSGQGGRAAKPNPQPTRASVATRSIGAIVLTLVGISAARAADPNEPGAWRFEATPYLWMAGMRGDVGIGRLSAEGVETSFGDLVKSLRAGFMGAFEARKDRFGILFDAIYMQLSESRPAPAPFLGDVHARPTQQAYALAALWRVSDAPGVDLVGGARVNDLKLDIDLSASPLAPRGRSVARSRSWVDAFVGARVQYPIAPQWTLVGYVDLGGGGSDFTWQALAGASYEITPATLLKFGYRYLKVDYHRSDFLYDVATGGPYAGVGIRF